MKQLFVLLLFCMFGLTACRRSDLPEIRIFIWSDYIKPDLIERFEKECNCRVILDTYDSNESMYAKLKLSALSYDVIFPSNYYLDIMIRQGMLQPLPSEGFPNVKMIDPRYLQAVDRSILNYAIPYFVTPTGIAYRKDKVHDFESSWSMFAQKAYKGRMTMLNDMREAIGAGLLFLGFSINTVNADEIEQAADLLIQWKHNLAKFESEQYKNGIASGEFLIVQGYAGDILQVIRENSEVAFNYPQEGIPFSIDYAAIPQNARDVLLAEKFINFLLQPDVAAENMVFTRHLSPLMAAYAKLPPELRNNSTLFPSDSVLEKAQLVKNVGDALKLYSRAWDRIKAAD